MTALLDTHILIWWLNDSPYMAFFILKDSLSSLAMTSTMSLLFSQFLLSDRGSLGSLGSCSAEFQTDTLPILGPRASLYLRTVVDSAIEKQRGEHMAEQQFPTIEDLLWPTLKALENHGGSASIQELSEQVASDLELSDEILDIQHKDGPVSEVNYRAAWARTALKRVGAIDNTSRGVWTITKVGRRIQTDKEVREAVRELSRLDHIKQQKEKQLRNAEPETENDDTADDQDWKEALLDIVRGIAPAAFERLCQLVLRESGFTKVEVTGRSGDGGIDGAGVLRINLISFHVRFQCKRYAGSVSTSEIRDFRGAMVGRADKGLFITTGRFTRDAEREAVRDGAPAIDLINGIDLCELLRKFELGVSTETVDVVRPRLEFFESL